MAERLPTIEELYALLDAQSKPIGLGGIVIVEMPDDERSKPQMSDPESSSWEPNIGPGYNSQEYMRSYYAYLLKEWGTY